MLLGRYGGGLQSLSTDNEEVFAGRQVGVRAVQCVRQVCMGARATGCLRGRIVVELQRGNASRQVLRMG